MRSWMIGLAVVPGLGALAAPPSVILQGEQKRGRRLYGSLQRGSERAAAVAAGHVGRIVGSAAAIWAETPTRVYVSVRGEIILPETVNGRKSGTLYLTSNKVSG